MNYITKINKYLENDDKLRGEMFDMTRAEQIVIYNKILNNEI